MPPAGTKRKHYPDDELAGNMAPQLSTRTEIPVPTPETQKLYDDWRRAQDQEHQEQLLTAGSLGRLSSGHSNSLEPPSPSCATTMSRTPSHASTAGSITRDIQGMAVNDGSPVTKRRRGRSGPLSPVDGLKTALIRKLGACGECSRRRVKCGHFDFRHFEPEYLKTKEAAALPVFRVPHPGTPTPGPGPNFDNSTNLLVGISGGGFGQNTIGHPSGRIQFKIPAADEAHPDLDLEQHNQSSDVRPHVTAVLVNVEDSLPPFSNPAPRYFPTTTRTLMAAPNITAAPSIPAASNLMPTSNPMAAHDFMTAPNITAARNRVAAPIITTVPNPRAGLTLMTALNPVTAMPLAAPSGFFVGRQLLPPFLHWSCFGAGGVPCNKLCSSREELKAHFEAAHNLFLRPRYWQKWSWNCLGPGCGFPEEAPAGPLHPLPPGRLCPDCQQPTERCSQEWCWVEEGCIAPGPTSLPVTLPASQGGRSTSNHSARTSWSAPPSHSSARFNNSNGSNSNNAMLSPFGYSSRGNPYDTRAASLEKKQPDHGLASAAADMWSSPVTLPNIFTIVNTNAPLAKYAACPVLVVLAIAAGAVLKTWLETGRVTGGAVGLELVVGWVMSLVVLEDGRVRFPLLALVCVVLGLGVASVWRHVKFRVKQQYEPRYLYKGDVYGGEDRVAVVA